MSALSVTLVSQSRTFSALRAYADFVLAKNQFASNPLRTIFDIKRMIGRKFNDKDVQRDMKHFPFKVINKGGQPRVEIDVKG